MSDVEKWQVTYAGYLSNRLPILLSVGWEPMTVVGGQMWLRRKVPPEACQHFHSSTLYDRGGGSSIICTDCGEMLDG
jgi:hypothetical protein